LKEVNERLESSDVKAKEKITLVENQFEEAKKSNTELVIS
jgi:hypothetical protein